MRRCLPLMLMFCLLSAATAQDEADTSLDKLLRKGVDLFDRDQYPAAKAVFKQILDKSPGRKDLLRLRQLAGVGKLLDIMEKGGTFEKFARALLATTAATGSKPLVPDAQLRRMVDQVVTGDMATRQRVFAELDSKGGERAVPHFIPHLLAGGPRRAKAIDALRRMGPQVVLPLVEVLHSGNDGLAEAAAGILGAIGDRRAAADLKWLASQGKGKAAGAAAVALGSVPTGDGGTPFSLYVALARGYYDNQRWTVTEALDRGQFWAWDNGLKGFRIPPYLFNLFQAERAAVRGLAYSPDDHQARVLTASILYAQHARTRDVLTGALSGRTFAITKAQLASARKTLDALAAHLGLALSFGARTAYGVLGRALAQDRRDVIREACNALARLVRRGSAPGQPLLDALGVRDNAVKFAAARALVRIDPAQPFAEADAAMRALEATVGQSGNRVALIIGGAAHVRNDLAYQLRSALRMEVFIAPGRQKGIKLAGQWPAEDVIFIDAYLGGMRDGSGAQSLIDLIRRNPSMARVPIFGLVKEGAPGNLRGIFSDRVLVLPLKPKEYLPKVRRELKTFSGDFKSEAGAAAAEAARTLATIDPARSVFKLSLARKGLIKALVREDAVRLPALTALGRLAHPSALVRLIKLLEDTKLAPTVRARAAWAIGMIQAGQGAPSVEVLDALTAGLRDAQAEVQRSCGEALGRCKLTSDQRRKLLEAQRLRPSETRPKK